MGKNYGSVGNGFRIFGGFLIAVGMGFVYAGLMTKGEALMAFGAGLFVMPHLWGE